MVSQQQLENLPLNGRQFANLAVLAPGTALAYNSDPTKPGQLTVALNGGIGRNVNFLVDGGDNTDDTIGGALQNFNLESVQEFNIQTQQYKAEYGRSTGGVLTVVTKTGTNNFAGSAWGFFRDDSLNSKTETEKLAGIDKQPYERKQYGARPGRPDRPGQGPLLRHLREDRPRDQLHRRHDPDPAGAIFPTFDGKSVRAPVQGRAADRQGHRQHLARSSTSRCATATRRTPTSTARAPLSAPDSLGTVTNKYSSILAGHSAADRLGQPQRVRVPVHQVRQRHHGRLHRSLPVLPLGRALRPEHQHAAVHAPDEVPVQGRLQLHPHARSAAPTTSSSASTTSTSRPSAATSRPAPPASSPSPPTISNSPVVDITFFGGFNGNDTPVNQYSVYAQDDLLLTDRLTVNVGLRYDYWDGFDLDQSQQPDLADALHPDPLQRGLPAGLPGRQGRQAQERRRTTSAPRLGFTWDLKGDGRQLLRGGYGRYYDFPYTNATILFPSAAVQSNYGVVYNVNNTNGIRNADGTLFRPGQPLPPNQLPGAAISPPNEVASPTLATPYSEQISLGYSWQATTGSASTSRRCRSTTATSPSASAPTRSTRRRAARRFPDFGNFRLWVRQRQGRL